MHWILLPYDDAWTDDRRHVEVVHDHISDYESEDTDKILRYVEEQRLDVVNALLKSPTIEVNPVNIQRDCLLHLVRYNDPSAAVIVSKLLDMGADVSACNGKAKSILHLACAANASSIVDDLLDRGYSIDTTDYQGLSALNSAIRAGSCETVQTIFSRDEDSARGYCLGVDAKVDCTDNNEHTPLRTYLSTFMFGDRVETCQLLLDRGANPLWNAPDGRDLGHLAVCHHTMEPGVLETLSNYGLDLTMKDKGGKSIVHHGAISGLLSLEIATFLHDRNLPDLHATDDCGKTPLDYALKEANKERSPFELARNRWKQTLETLQSFC